MEPDPVASVRIWSGTGPSRSDAPFLVIAASEDLYVGAAVEDNLLPRVRTLQTQGKLVVAIEGGMAKTLARRLQKIPVNDIEANEAHEGMLWLTVDGRERPSIRYRSPTH